MRLPMEPSSLPAVLASDFGRRCNRIWLPFPCSTGDSAAQKSNRWSTMRDQIVTPYHPRAVVLFAGTNDLGQFNTKTAQEVFEGYVEFVNAIHTALPQMPIYYIAITPTPSRWKYWPVANEANQRIKTYTETDHRLHFIDMTNEILGSDGQPRRELFIWDKLHPSTKGYALWTTIIKPILEADLFKRQELTQG